MDSSRGGRRPDRVAVPSVQERAGRLARRTGWPNAADQDAADVLAGLIAILTGCGIMLLAGAPLLLAGGVLIVFVLLGAYVTAPER